MSNELKEILNELRKMVEAIDEKNEDQARMILEVIQQAKQDLIDQFNKGE
ncbi:hypothetical protein ACAX43_12430 [Paraburkholderia sp. IW21]